MSSLEFQSLDEFASFDEPGADPLVSDSGGGAAIAAGSLVVVYGGGGAGKTTAIVDWLVSWAAGRSWLGLLTPASPVRAVVIENEGPRPMFREKLRTKLEALEDAVGGQIELLTEPWARFSFRDSGHTAELAAHLAESKADLLVAGPISRLGMEGGGTLEQINEFVSLVEGVQRSAGRSIAVVLVHHENRSGQVSGAWEGMPDTLAHVQSLGHGRTRIYWQKARWSSTLHGTTTNLLWAPGATYTIEQRQEVTEESIADRLLEATLETPGASWTKIRASVKGKGTTVQAVRDRLLADGLLVNGADRSGVFLLWHHEDPAAPRSLVGTAWERATFPPTGPAPETDRSPFPT